jgi:geranylgeranyl diphosphate synthase type I
VIRTAPAVLDRARAHVAPAMQDAVDGMSPELLIAIRYHLGYADADGTPVAAGGGKGVRPALAVLSAEAAGADARVGVPGAVAVELVHNFSLLHDDVVDGDRERRHRITVWALFGVGQAIIGGDALLTLALDVLLTPATPARARAAAALVRATDRMIAGQASDMAFETRHDVSIDECLAMEQAKTGALLSCASSIGALLADADDRLVDALAAYGAHLGVAFQAVDDLLGIWGSPDVTGKPAGSDLRQHKKALPLLFALEAGDGPDDELQRLFAGGSLSEADVARATELVDARGGRERTEEVARNHLDVALDSIADVGIPSDVHAELDELARFVVEREF